MTIRLSSETIHATCVALDGRAVLISGPSGAGKSDLALRLIDRGFTLVSDDQVLVRRSGERLLAAAPAAIAGKLEIRGIGIMEMETVGDVPICLIVDLTSDIRRMPDDSRERSVLGMPVPLISVDAATASAAAKVALALERFGRTA
jgi:serine kinase of HPr protein (carbohydrate metabolism regulator)